jgi:hypothetical protein
MRRLHAIKPAVTIAPLSTTGYGFHFAQSNVKDSLGANESHLAALLM